MDAMEQKPPVTARQLAGMFDHTLLKPYVTDEEFRTLCADADRFGFCMVAINSAQTALCRGFLKESPVHVGAAISFPLGQKMCIRDSDIAYCVHKNFWCQGYATEIAQGMIDYARSQGAEKVTIYVGQENAASNRVAQKCGGKIVSERTYKHRGTDIIMTDYKYEIVL